MACSSYGDGVKFERSLDGHEKAPNQFGFGLGLWTPVYSMLDATFAGLIIIGGAKSDR